MGHTFPDLDNRRREKPARWKSGASFFSERVGGRRLAHPPTGPCGEVGVGRGVNSCERCLGGQGPGPPFRPPSDAFLSHTLPPLTPPARHVLLEGEEGKFSRGKNYHVLSSSTSRRGKSLFGGWRFFSG